MTSSSASPTDEEVARLAHSLWQSDGAPHGHDQEYWFRAREILANGGNHAPGESSPDAPREVQPGFQDAPPGLVPDMKPDAGAELTEGPGGRFAEQIADAPQARPKRPSRPRTKSPTP